MIKHHFTNLCKKSGKIVSSIFLILILLASIFSYTAFAAEHNWGEWIADKEPTCTQSGSKHRTCTADALPHREIEDIAPLGHDYAGTVKEPTCTEGGVKTYTCTRCGDSYTEAFGEPLGHQYTEEITTPATYDKEGLKTFTCTRCGDTYTETILRATEHDHQYEATSETKPTCETEGKITYACKICGDSYTELVPVLGHDYGEWITDKEPGLLESGHRYKVCARDNTHVIEEALPPIITFELNTFDVVTTPINTGFLIFFAITLLSDLYVILWDLRKRKRLSKITRLKRRLILAGIALLIFTLAVTVALKLLVPMTFFNLLGITVFITVLTIGVVLRLVSRKKVASLDGDGGIYKKGHEKGHLISKG